MAAQVMLLCFVLRSLAMREGNPGTAIASPRACGYTGAAPPAWPAPVPASVPATRQARASEEMAQRLLGGAGEASSALSLRVAVGHRHTASLLFSSVTSGHTVFQGVPHLDLLGTC